MTNARKRNAFFSWVSSLTLMQEAYVGMGVSLFIVAIVAGSGLVRILLIIGGGVLTWLVLRSFLHYSAQRTAEEESQHEEKEKNSTVKKLFFDDFQASGSQYKIQFVDEGDTQHQQTEIKAPSQKKATHTMLEWDVNAFVENIEPSRDSGPRGEFTVLTLRILSVIKEVSFAHTVALFWVNRDKQHLVLENVVTDSTLFIPHRRLELGNDYISQVAHTGKPLLANFVAEASQQEVLPYYTAKEQIRTFLGIPVFYPGQTTASTQPIAVLTVDCCEEDAYGNETIALMAHFAKLLSTLLVSYTAKYDLLQDAEVLQALARFRQRLEEDFSVPVVARTLAEETSRLVPWDYIAVVLHDDTRKEWLVHHVLNRMNDAYVPLLSEVDIDTSVVGKVVQSGNAQVVENVQMLHQPRFYPAERCNSEGALMAIPINSLTRCYGALVVESKDSRRYAENDVAMLRKFTDVASWALETLSLLEITNKYLSLDETTGVATRKTFMDRLHEEVQRAHDFGDELSVVMIALDRVDEHLNRYGKEAFDLVLQNVGRIIKSAVRPYDIVGRFDFNCFAAALISTTPNEAALWAEKVRKNVASNIINIENKNFSVTVSVGVAGVLEHMSDMELLENATRALTKAREAGGNILRVF